MVGVVTVSPEAARVTCTSAVQVDCISILPYVAISKDAFPRNPAHAAGRAKSFSLPTQAQVSHVQVSPVKYQAQYQAFVRFAVGSGTAL
jgi:hypothetical protein